MSELTREQKRIRIAEACGWTEISPCTCCHGVSRGVPPFGVSSKHLPDYFGSLDAIAEARKSLTPEQQFIYAKHLAKLTCEYLTNHQAIFSNWMLCDATAEQHAEAFGKTLNLW